MNTNIQVRYRHIPSEITIDLENLKSSNLSVSITHDKKEYFNFSGGPTDILIYIDEHFTEIIATGMLAPTVYDLLKYSIQSTWKKLVQHYKKNKKELEDDKNQIELNFKLKQDKTIEFNLKCDINEKTINNTVDKIFEYLKEQTKQEEHFANPDYKGNFDLKPKIRLRYNPQTEKWEPVNFAEIKKRLDELMGNTNFEN